MSNCGPFYSMYDQKECYNHFITAATSMSGVLVEFQNGSVVIHGNDLQDYYRIFLFTGRFHPEDRSPFILHITFWENSVQIVLINRKYRVPEHVSAPTFEDTNLASIIPNPNDTKLKDITGWIAWANRVISQQFNQKK